MPLEEYNRKRDFDKTPEPRAAQTKSPAGELKYLIQKHDSTRLHYDFRLELDGVLLSWAVTKGPSLNPADKRLAVRTEDHPLAYGSFEGTIPEGQYGGGTVMLWDRGTWEPKSDPRAGLKRGHLSMLLHGQRLKGGWDLIRMRGDGKRENWLLIKEKDEEARAKGGLLENSSSSVQSGRSMDEIAEGKAPARKPSLLKRTVHKSAVRNRAVHPKKTAATTVVPLEGLMQRYAEVELATLVDRPPEGDQWLSEIKFDGYRLLGFVTGGSVRLVTRNGKDWTEKFPSVAQALENLEAASAVIDMEAVIVDVQGKTSFQALQAALGEGGNRNKIVAYAFDLLHLDGKDLTALPLSERKKSLQALLQQSPPNPAMRYSEHIVGQGAAMFAKACETGLEGIIAKKVDAPYEPGRQKNWLKIKCTKRQEFIIVGYSAARTGDRALGALYLGYRQNGALQYAGKVGTGFSMKSATELAKRFRSLAAAEPVLTRAQTGDVTAHEFQSIRWVKPNLLCEVAFTEWTNDGRIRHPSFQGLREDKNAGDVKKENPMPTTAVAKTARAKPQDGGLVAAGVTISHPDRVISETGHITKGELAEYHEAIAPFMLPRIARHPLSLLRCPSGIGKQCFYQRNPGKGLGPDVHPFEFRHAGKKNEYLYIEDAKGLLEIIQMGAIEIHPWGASIDTIDCPDRLIFDLDPAADVPFEALKLAAEDLRQRLTQKGLESTVKTTGSKGLHVTVALAAKDRWPVVKAFAASLANEMAADAPDAYIATMSKAKRAGKIFIDYLRNDYTATAIADYSVRALPGAPVALPFEWRELKKLQAADQFKMADVLKRANTLTPEAASGRRDQRIPAP